MCAASSAGFVRKRSPECRCEAVTGWFPAELGAFGTVDVRPGRPLHGAAGNRDDPLAFDNSVENLGQAEKNASSSRLSSSGEDTESRRSRDVRWFVVASRKLRSSELVTALGVVILATLYVGASFAAPVDYLPTGQQVSLFWPPTGIGLAAFFYLRPLVTAPTILVSSFLLNASFGRPLGPSLAAAVATACGLTAIYLLLRWVDFHSRLDRLRDVLALVFLGALVGGMILGWASVGALVLTGVFPPGLQWRMTLLWGMSFGTGVLICTPALLVLRHARWPRRIRPLRVVEAVGLEAAAVAVVLLIALTAAQPLFLAFPVVVWAALRFQMAGAAPVALFLSAATVYTQTGAGPWGGQLVSEMGVIEGFIASMTLTALLLAVIITERDRAYRDIRHVSDQLLLAVDKLDRRLRPRPSEIAGRRDEIAQRRDPMAERQESRAAQPDR